MKLEVIEREIIDCLKNAQPRDLSINDIARSINRNRLVVSKYVAVLVARGVIIQTRSVGRAKMFQLARDYLDKITPKIRIQFDKDYLQYRRGNVVTLPKETAQEYIKLGYAHEAPE